MKTIIRVKKADNYTVIDNNIPYNTALSLKAKGLLLYLLSKPDDWVTNVVDIANHNQDGIKSVNNGLKELIERKFPHILKVNML